jgi:hypothetical protein
MRRAVIMALASAGIACADATGVVCTEEARPALSVSVRDVASGGTVAGSRVIARDGEYADTASDAFLGLVYSLAYERAGSYEVTVENGAYVTWRQVGVQVTKDECHVQTVSLTARLTPKE